MKLPNAIAKHRRKALMTQEELARAVSLSRGRLSMFEAGHTLPDKAELEAIAEVLGVKAEVLYPSQVRAVINKYGG